MDKYDLMSREELIAELLRIDALLRVQVPVRARILFVRETDEND